MIATPARGVAPFQSSAEVKGGGGNSAAQLASQIYTDNGAIHNMVVTYDGMTLKYYLDGASTTFADLPNSFTDIGLMLSNLTTIGLGGGAPFVDNTIKGKIHDFRIYGRSLSASQVTAVFNLGPNATNVQVNSTVDLPVPTGLSASVGNNQVALTWNASTGAASYNVKRATTSGGPFSIIANPTTASYSDSSAVNGATYYYVVSAMNASGQSANSVEAAAVLRSASESWRQTHFGTASNTGNAATLANPDGDQLLNVWEFFHGTDPNAATANPVQTEVVGDHLTITFPRSTAAGDVTVTVQGADSLRGSWTDLARSIDGAPFAPVVSGVAVSEEGTGVTRTVEVQDRYLVSDPAHPKRFLRLSVEAQ